MGVVCHADRGAVFPLYAKHHVVIICLLRSLVNFMVIGTATLSQVNCIYNHNNNVKEKTGKELNWIVTLGILQKIEKHQGGQKNINLDCGS